MEEKTVRIKCEIWSRVVGYLRPTSSWNEGKVEEFKNRKMFEVKEEEIIKEEKEK